ncbi:cytochrome b/b6 domain-containing protein [Rhodoferax lithotrophicus]|nr:cytochrome b/b6 domain-containing protein [Rhodoferax sp. MIZ03]
MHVIVRIWDAPTRLFHWLLVICFTGLLITANLGGSAMVWHFRLGYTVFSLLLFRFFWGFLGGYWSRFATFLYSPSAMLHYVKGHSEPQQSVGHNPLGALSVFALLAFLSFQVASGLMSDDEISAAGPLTRFVSGDWVTFATFYHKEIGKLVLLFLVATHLTAIGYYFFSKKDNLVSPMLKGDKTLSFNVPKSSDTSSDRAKAAFIFIVCAAFVTGLVSFLD